MSALDSRPDWTGEIVPAANALVILELAAAVLLAIGVVFAPRAVAWGWLVGFLFWSSAAARGDRVGADP